MWLIISQISKISWMNSVSTFWCQIAIVWRSTVCTGIKKQNECIYFWWGWTPHSLVLWGPALSIEPLTNLNKVYSMVVWDERQQNMTKSMETKTTTEATVFKPSTATRARQGGPKCTYCLKLGHEKSQCYELNGYPSSWQGRKGNRFTQVPNWNWCTGPSRSEFWHR